MSLRENDDGGGRPNISPRIVSAEEKAKGSHNKNEDQTRENFPLKTDNSKPFSKFGSWANPFRNSTLTSCILLFTLVACLWLLTQISALWRDLQIMPLFLSIPMGALVTILIWAILWRTFKVVRQWRKWRETPQWQWRELQLLDQQGGFRQGDVLKAKSQLKQHLLETPWGERHYQNEMAALGLQDAQLERIMGVREQLLQMESSDSSNWLRRYAELYLAEIDELARQRIRRGALRLGMSTASCPHRQLDGFLTLWSSFELCSDLCKIYNLRLGKLALLILLVRSFRNTFIATQVEDLADHALDSLTDQLHQGISGLATELGQWLGSRMAEGTANAWLLYRLGKATQSQLRPIHGVTFKAE